MAMPACPKLATIVLVLVLVQRGPTLEICHGVPAPV
jgi:hypothetical protein